MDEQTRKHAEELSEGIEMLSWPADHPRFRQAREAIAEGMAQCPDEMIEKWADKKTEEEAMIFFGEEMLISMDEKAASTILNMNFVLRNIELFGLRRLVKKAYETGALRRNNASC